MAISIDNLNISDFEDFIKHVGGAVEHFSVLMAGLWSHRPFTNLQDMYTKMCRIVDEMPFELKEGILRVHPDLAGRLAEQNALTEESTNEQQSAGLNSLSSEEKQYLHTHNEAYKQKFGFPFVICARENKKESIMRGIKERFENDKQSETLNGVEEVKKIAWFRLSDIVSEDQKPLVPPLANI